MPFMSPPDKNKPKNVLYISNQTDFNGGASRSLCDLIQNLDRSRYRPFFASLYDGEVAKVIKNQNVPFLKLNPSIYCPPFFAISSVNLLAKFISKNHIQLIHNNQCVDTLFSWLPAKITDTPIIIHHRDPSFYKRDRFLVNHVDANIANSQWQNEHNLSNKGIVIHEGVDLALFDSIQNTIPQEIAKSGKVVVGLLGRIVPYKAQDIFVRAAALVLQKVNSALFLIIGDDQDARSLSYIDSIKTLIKDLGIQESVKFTGYIAEGWKVLPALDISVVPSRKEAFGRVTIESMACSKPVIATNVWGSLDIVTPETGLLVPPDDPEKLADAILTLLRSPEKRKAMGEAGRRRVEDNFTIDLMMERIYQLYESVLTRKNENRNRSLV